MKNNVLALTIIALFCFLTATVSALPPFGEDYRPYCTLHSPSGVQTYTTTNVEIAMDYYQPINFTQIGSFCYSLDDNQNETLGFTSKVADKSYGFMDYTWGYIDYYVSGELTNLTNAQHTITIYGYFSNETSTIIYNKQQFRVNTDFEEPQLIVSSPQNLSIYDNGVPLIYSTNSEILMAYYRLDSTSANLSDDWTTFSGNTTLTGLSNGSHRLTIFVVTEANTQSTQASCTETIDFSVNATENQTNQNYTQLIILLISLSSAVVVLLAVFLRSHRKDRTN